MSPLPNFCSILVISAIKKDVLGERILPMEYIWQFYQKPEHLTWENFSISINEQFKKTQQKQQELNEQKCLEREEREHERKLKLAQQEREQREKEKLELDRKHKQEQEEAEKRERQHVEKKLNIKQKKKGKDKKKKQGKVLKK